MKKLLSKYLIGVAEFLKHLGFTFLGLAGELHGELSLREMPRRYRPAVMIIILGRMGKLRQAGGMSRSEH